MTQALGLPLHDVIAKSRVINSGWNFMLIICAPCEYCQKRRKSEVSLSLCVCVCVCVCVLFLFVGGGGDVFVRGTKTNY